MDTIESILKRDEVQLFGKGTVLFSFVAGGINLINRMDIINPIIIAVSGILGIFYLYYKLKMIHLDYVERKEKRKHENLPEIRFRFKFWNRWKRKK